VNAVWHGSNSCADYDSCVEGTIVAALVDIRNSKDADRGEMLVFERPQWRAFAATSVASTSTNNSNSSRVDGNPCFAERASTGMHDYIR
jgi:hypothetical protein